MGELKGVSDHSFEHPYLDVLPREEWRWGFQEKNNLVMLYQGDRPFVIALGEEKSAVAELLERSKEHAPSARISVQRRHGDLLQGEKSEWDWMGIFQQPSYRSSFVVEDLGTDHDDDVRKFLAVASPTASTEPGSSEVVTWHAIREHRAITAVGAAIRWKSGAAVLASIATDPELRGQGQAAAVTASLTKMFFDAGEHRVTLGLYAQNNAARRTYEKVGYRLLEEFTSASR